MMDNGILEKIVKFCVIEGGSDIHLSEDFAPSIRVDGELKEMSDCAVDRETIEEIVKRYTKSGQLEKLEKSSSADFGFSMFEERFRGHAYRERGKVTLALRKLEKNIRSIAELGLPHEISGLSLLRDGLVLLSGPTGSGKSTTIASLINMINATRRVHIVTIEDPVEYIYPSGKALVHQRELHSDVATFASAVRESLREDPDVVLVGEMRDTETMSAAVRVAETGHLVFSTLHTGNCTSALGRIIGSFPPEEHPALLQQLSQVLRAVVVQHLLPRQNGGRVVATEVLMVNPAVANLVRQNKSESLYSMMESGAASGMRTLEQSLAELVTNGSISIQTAKQAASYPDLLMRRLN